VPAFCTDQLPNSLELFGLRPGLVDLWGANSGVGPGICAFQDDLNNIPFFVLPVTDEENQACINILLNSQMLQLNNCP